MGTVTVIWTLGGVLAAACAGRALSMRTSGPLLSEILWYMGGAYILVGVCVLWASLEPQAVPQQRIVVTIIGAIAGALTALFICELVRPTAAEAQAVSGGPVTQTLGFPFQVAQNVISNNQSGGITARTVNIGPIPRTLSDDVRAASLKAQILKDLPRDKPISVMAIMGDAEAISFAQEIALFLKANNFPLSENGGVSQGVFAGPVKGLALRDDGDHRTFIVGSNQ